MKYGLIGKPLGHSISPLIHSLLGNNEYELSEINEEDLAAFFEKREFKGINVTIPYKEKVIEYLDYIDDNAKRIGCVNTIVNKAGKLYGYNTDYLGFKELLKSSHLEVKDKKVLILGTGGTSKTVKTVLEDLGVQNIEFVSRVASDTKISYEEALERLDTQIIVNTTPVGMYPNTSKYPIALHNFNKLEAVFDVIYNPLKTRLVCFAKRKRIVAQGGLKMLVSQAIAAHELFFDTIVEEKIKQKIYKKIEKKFINIVLIGMPGCGKSTIAKYLGENLDKKVIDLDSEVEKYAGKTIKEIFEENGEDYFRELETKMTRFYAKQNGQIISTGGGIIKNKKNIEMLRQNGLIIYINRDISLFDEPKSDKRPLSKSKSDLEKLYQERHHLYVRYSDIVVKNDDKFIECAIKIKEGFDENNDN